MPGCESEFEGVFVGSAEEALGVGGEGGAEGGKCGFLIGEVRGSNLRRMLELGSQEKGDFGAGGCRRA